MRQIDQILIEYTEEESSKTYYSLALRLNMDKVIGDLTPEENRAGRIRNKVLQREVLSRAREIRDRLEPEANLSVIIERLEGWEVMHSIVLKEQLKRLRTKKM